MNFGLFRGMFPEDSESSFDGMVQSWSVMDECCGQT